MKAIGSYQKGEEYELQSCECSICRNKEDGSGTGCEDGLPERYEEFRCHDLLFLFPLLVSLPVI